MRISVAEAEGQLDELVRRAEAGDEIVLTRDGGRDVRLVPELQPKPNREGLRELVAKIQKSAAKTALPGPCAARSQDFLYDDETGLPK